MMQSLIIKGRIPDLNEYSDAERRNRYTGAKLKKEWTALIAGEAKAQKLKSMESPLSVLFIFFVKDRKRDKDNLLINTKWGLDGLVKAGIIKNDGWNDIVDLTFHWELDKKERMEIILENERG